MLVCQTKSLPSGKGKRAPGWEGVICEDAPRVGIQMQLINPDGTEFTTESQGPSRSVSVFKELEGHCKTIAPEMWPSLTAFHWLSSTHLFHAIHIEPSLRLFLAYSTTPWGPWPDQALFLPPGWF
ncbi:hypothetical protein CapIbe_001847 [Capra ibex]